MDYDSHFERWREKDEYYRAMACNMMHDGRVVDERAALFHAEYGTKEERLEDAIGNYYWERVRSAAEPDFCLDPNGENIVAGAGSKGLTDPDPDIRLLTFLDLNGLRGLYDWAKENPRQEYRKIFDLYQPNDVEEGFSDAELSNWLSANIARFGKKPFAQAVLEARKAYRSDPAPAHFNPVWVTLFEPLEKFLKPEFVDRWCELVGVHKASFPRWIVPLSWKVFDAGTVARPSILDAGWRAHHFPTPKTGRFAAAVGVWTWGTPRTKESRSRNGFIPKSISAITLWSARSHCVALRRGRARATSRRSVNGITVS